MNRPYAKAFLVLALLLAFPRASRAWGPIAHYLITEARLEAHNALPGNSGNQLPLSIAQYANLPDAWPSNSSPDYGLSISITPFFCWSHGVRDTGVVNLSLNSVEVPRVPLYHSGFPDCEPGHVMESLLGGKVNLYRRWGDYVPPPGTPGIPTHLAMAARGFRMHNEEDSDVHWSYFLGATGGEASNADILDKWTIHHGLKEHWAEYVLLATQVFGKRELVRGDFDSSGHIVLPTGFSSDMLAIAGLDGNNYSNQLLNSLAWLLRLSQLAYRKNRTSRSCLDSGQYGIDVQTMPEIKALLREQDIGLRGHFSKAHWATWEAGYFNFQDGSLEVELLNGNKDTIDYDTPGNLWIEWQMLKHLADNEYPGSWQRTTLHQNAGLSDISPQNP